MYKLFTIVTVSLLLIGCRCCPITDTNQTFAIHTGSVNGDPCLLTDCSAECDKCKWYVIEAPGVATMQEPHQKCTYKI